MVEPFMKQGMPVFDARKAAAKQLVAQQTQKLLAMKADELRAFAEKALSKQASQAASGEHFHLGNPGSGLSFTIQGGKSEQEVLDAIFDKMGSSGHR
jgi:hypothetical protein